VLQAHQPALPVEGDSDGVEAELGRPGAVWSPLSKPFARHQPQLLPLAHADRRERPGLARRPGKHPRLDLAEDEVATIGHHQVELAVARAEVRVEQREAARLQVSPRQLLALGAKLAAGIGFGHCRRRYAGPAHACATAVTKSSQTTAHRSVPLS
jgi:hypothetical protein